MEIGRWLFYAVVNCIFVCIAAKSVSLNELIEAESQQNRAVQATSAKLEEIEPTVERFSLGLKPSRRHIERNRIGSIIPLGKKISPLKYRKTFQIQSPLKPKRIKHSFRTRQKRKNQSVKREVSDDVKLKQKYIPLLRSLGMLFDNILGDSSESSEATQSKRKRLRYYFGDDDEPCQCATDNTPSESEEEAATSTEFVSAEIERSTLEATTKTTYNPPTRDVSRLRQNKVVPVLLPRNTSGTWRDNNGLGERSRSPHHRSSKGDISGDSRDSKHDPEWGDVESGQASDEEYTDSYPRNRTSSLRFRVGVRNGQSGSIAETAYEDGAIPEDEAEIPLDSAGGLVGELKGEDKLEIRGDEAKSAKPLSKPVRRLRGSLPEDQIGDTAKPVQSQEDNEESHVDVTHNSSGDQRVPDGSGPPAAKDQETSSEHETLVEHTFTNTVDISTKPSRKKFPVVTIVDGYSVTRHKNGENKISEKAIHIHSK